jgi:hypothetical protein
MARTTHTVRVFDDLGREIETIIFEFDQHSYPETIKNHLEQLNSRFRVVVAQDAEKVTTSEGDSSNQQ